MATWKINLTITYAYNCCIVTTAAEYNTVVVIYHSCTGTGDESILMAKASFTWLSPFRPFSLYKFYCSNRHIKTIANFYILKDGRVAPT